MKTSRKTTKISKIPINGIGSIGLRELKISAKLLRNKLVNTKRKKQLDKIMKSIKLLKFCVF